MPASLPTGYDPLIDGWNETRGQRALMTQFGDGYLQRSPDGLNTLIETHTFSLYAKDQADTNELQDFLDARGMVDAIVMQMPGSAIAKNYLMTAPYQKQALGNGANLFTIEVRWNPDPQPSTAPPPPPPTNFITFTGGIAKFGSPFGTVQIQISGEMPVFSGGAEEMYAIGSFIYRREFEGSDDRWFKLAPTVDNYYGWLTITQAEYDTNRAFAPLVLPYTSYIP